MASQNRNQCNNDGPKCTYEEDDVEEEEYILHA